MRALGTSWLATPRGCSCAASKSGAAEQGRGAPSRAVHAGHARDVCAPQGRRHRYVRLSTCDCHRPGRCRDHRTQRRRARRRRSSARCDHGRGGGEQAAADGDGELPSTGTGSGTAVQPGSPTQAPRCTCCTCCTCCSAASGTSPSRSPAATCAGAPDTTRPPPPSQRLPRCPRTATPAVADLRRNPALTPPLTLATRSRPRRPYPGCPGTW